MLYLVFKRFFISTYFKIKTPKLDKLIINNYNYNVV